jgi:hypothetical protein
LLFYPETDEFGLISHRFKQDKEPASLAESTIGSFAVDVIDKFVDVFEVAGFVVFELLAVAVIGIRGGTVVNAVVI